jgi:hypothetical protein
MKIEDSNKIKIEDSNKMIAVFLGCKVKGYIVYRLDNENISFVDDLKYHTSWDWLMPVVEKIEAMGYTVVIHREATLISAYDNDLNCIWKTTKWDQEVKINHVYQAIVQFIQWYNQNH